MNDLAVGDTVIMTCDNGAVIAGPWNGTATFQNEPIVTVGKRTEYFRSVTEIVKVTECVRVFKRES